MDNDSDRTVTETETEKSESDHGFVGMSASSNLNIMEQRPDEQRRPVLNQFSLLFKPS